MEHIFFIQLLVLLVIQVRETFDDSLHNLRLPRDGEMSEEDPETFIHKETTEVHLPDKLIPDGDFEGIVASNKNAHIDKA